MWKASLPLLVLATFLGCQRSPPRAAEPLRRVTVACTVQPQSTLIHVALAKGYFVEEGLDAKPLILSYGKVALGSVLEHKADFATVAETPVMFNVLKGERLFIIATIEASKANNAIVARKDAGISTPGDLKGKRIGFTPGTTSEFFLDSLLTSVGLAKKDIQPVAMEPEAMEEALLGKKVDATCTWNYTLDRIKRRLGPAGIVFFDREIFTETYNLAAQQAFVQKNPETVLRFIRALIKAEQFVASNPKEAQSIMSQATNTDPSIVREVWNAFNYRVVLEETVLITLEDETRWAMKHGLTSQKVMPDYLAFIHADSLRAVKPQAVKIPR